MFFHHPVSSLDRRLLEQGALCALIVLTTAMPQFAQSPGVADLLASTPVRVFSSDGVTDPSSPGGSIRFGEAVALDGDLLAVGAPLEWGTAGAGTSGTGAVYLFERQGGAWPRIQKIRAPVETPFENFGESVGIARGYDIDGPLDVLVVGASNFAAGDGRVVIYHRRPGEDFEHEFTFDGPTGSRFGESVAIDWFVGPNTLNGEPLFFIAVGASNERDPDDPGNSQHGSISILQRGGGPPVWGLRQAFYGQDPNNRIGKAIAMSGADAIAAGNVLPLGGAQAVRQNNFGGTGFFYSLNWELIPTTPAASGIGASAALYWDYSDTGVAAYGAPLDSSEGLFQRGKVYVFDLTPGGTGTTRTEVASMLGSAAQQRLGASVALSRNLLLATSRGPDNLGAVEVYERGATGSDWTHVGTFDTPNGPSPFSPCVVGSEGTSIAIQDSTVAIGCGRPGSSLENDSVYLYFPRRLFEDGFESGDTTAWSSTSP